jgi:serine/threonine protein phosphatase PrpC
VTVGKGIIEVANISDTGLKRPHNEDSAVTDTALGLAVVADGMGGYKAGEVASAIRRPADPERGPGRASPTATPTPRSATRA